MQLDERNIDEVLAAIRMMSKEQCLRVNAECVDRIKTIRRAETRKVAATLDVGTRVQVVRNIKPQYMVGVTGRVKRVLQTKVLVTLDPGQYLGRFQGADELRIPISSLKVLD